MFTLKFIQLDCLDELRHMLNIREEKRIEADTKHQEIRKFDQERSQPTSSGEMIV